jgi:DNA repair protein RadC
MFQSINFVNPLLKIKHPIMPNETNYRSILDWAEEDRPREKMLLKGCHSLSDAELIAILLGSGSIGESAVGLAQRILGSVENNLHELGKRSLQDLQRFKGVGEAKAISIAAALELGRRRQITDLRERPRISSSRDAFNVIAPFLTDLHHEEFWLLFLNKACEVISREKLSIGGSAGTVADVKLAFKKALDARASAIIAVHNHPSGNLKPSDADKELTRKMKEAGKVLDLPLLDHLIISERGYYSFADEGLV